MTNWFDGIVNDIVTSIEAVFAKKTDLNSKQDKLVSGTNIKTVNNNSLLGSGDITIQGGSNVTKTSDLTNDGDDGINAFVSDNDSRLTNARTPTAHNQALSTITDAGTVQVLVTYTDDTTETITLVKQTSNS